MPKLFDKVDSAISYPLIDIENGINLKINELNPYSDGKYSYIRIDTEITEDNIYEFNLYANNTILEGAYLFQKKFGSYAGKFNGDKSINFSNFLKIGIVSIEIIVNTNTIKKSSSIKINMEQLSNHYVDQKKDVHLIQKRENPTIIVTGFWPPTNEMIRHFSQNKSQNPNGWAGENWEESGYDIVSYFPEFTDPDCSSCGQGSGDFEVDYQDTSNDFWPIFNNKKPIAIITFSRGYIDRSWELEYNYYNRTNWYPDYNAPTLPTPNPPDAIEENYFLRNSSLPMVEIVNSIDQLGFDLDPYIDWNGDPGKFVSEFMGYHGVWYHDLNIYGEVPCLSAGHVHVGGLIDTETARLAADETIRVLIEHLDSISYTLGDLNEDLIIDILDIVIIVGYILGTIDLDLNQMFAADINEDSIINIQDIIGIINIVINS